MRIRIKLPNGGKFPLGWSESDGHIDLPPGTELLALPIFSDIKRNTVSFFRAEVSIPGTNRLTAIEIPSRNTEVVH